MEEDKAKEIIQIKHQITDNLLKEVAFFVLLPNPTNFSLLQEALDNVKYGVEQYHTLMKKYAQSPKDIKSYKKSKDVIKLKLSDILFKKYLNEIDLNFEFFDRFMKEMKLYIEDMQQKEITEDIESNIGYIAFELMTRKEKEEPQIELLKEYLSDKSEELNLKKDFKVERLIKLGHANDVYLVSNTEINQDDPNTIDYYAKSFSQNEIIYANNGLISPNELLVYKILEYTGFGPECWFLMKTASSFNEGTVCSFNFVLTRNVGKGDGVNFLLDNEDNKELFKEIFSNKRNFAIEISAAASINSIFALWDTFNNSGNYGVVFNNNSLEKLRNNKDLDIKDYNIMFIDHLPYGGNGIFHQLYCYRRRNDERYNTTKYSPRQNLIKTHQEKPHTLIELAENSKEKFSKDKIIKEVYKRLLNNEVDDQLLDRFKEKLKKAKEDVMTLLDKYTENFYSSEEKSAYKILDDYCKRIIYSIEFFDEKYKENTELDSNGLECSNHGMEDKDIELILQSLKNSVASNDKNALFFIEEKVLNHHNMIDKIESWSNLKNKQSEFLAIVTVINSENKKHAVLLHSTK